MHERSVHERVGEAFELGEQLTVVGHRLTTGQKAPPFSLDWFTVADSTMRQVELADSAGKVRLLNVINSIDTPVCHNETQHWEQLRDQLPSDLVVYTISMDVAYALGRWQNSTGTEHQLLSAYRSERFGQEYGVLIKEWRLLQRAVFVIDRNDRIAHSEYVADQMTEPDYAAAVVVAKQAAAT